MTVQSEPFAVPDPSSIPAPIYDQIFTPEQLKQFNGKDKPQIYVAIKGIVFDVTSKAANYGPGGSYHVFAGNDASCALGKSSLKLEDVHADYSLLDQSELKVLDDWMEYFKKRYPIVGMVKRD